MSSTGVHDLFQDMYRYTDPYAQEGAHTHTQPAPAPTPSYPYQQPSYSTGGGSANDHSSFDQYGRQPQHNSNSYPHSQQPYSNIGAGAAPAPSSHAPPAQAPPTYNDVQIHRDQVAYPYQPTHTPTTPNYPYQPSTAPASQSYQYPHSMSSSTSELSDVSSGFGASDGKPSGTSPAMGHPMTSPPTGGMARPYTSGGSSVDSSSGVGSYNCEPPEHADTTYTPHPVGRQDPLPAPPPSLHEASVIDYNHSEQQCFNAEDTPNPSTPITDPVTAPPPAPAPPPPPPPPPPLPQSCPPKSWESPTSRKQLVPGKLRDYLKYACSRTLLQEHSSLATVAECSSCGKLAIVLLEYCDSNTHNEKFTLIPILWCTILIQFCGDHI